MHIAKGLIVLALSAFLGNSLFAQDGPRRVASPAGFSATEVGARYDVVLGNRAGKWIEIRYGRPIKRNRNLFEVYDWREALLDGAPVWRAGANVSTRLTTQLPLLFGDTTLPSGEYTVFIDFKPDGWEFIVSTWPAQINYVYENKEALWGAYEYTSDRDVLRVPMQVVDLPQSFDQLSWQFVDMTENSGRLVLLWDKIQASVPFSFDP